MNAHTRLSDVKVGLFVISALVIFITGILWITNSTLFRGDQKDYWVLMRDSGAIKKGDRARIAGVDVGRIKEIRLLSDAAWPVGFLVGLDSNIDIRANSRARIAKTGLIAAPFLQIDPGTGDAPSLPAGGTIHGQESVGFEQALVKAAELSERTAKLVAEISEELPVILKQVSSITADLHNALGPGGARIAAVLDTAQRALDSVAEAASVVNANKEDISAGIDDVRSAVADLASLVNSNKADLSAAARDLRDAASNIKEFSQAVKERPYSLIRIIDEPDRQPGQGL